MFRDNHKHHEKSLVGASLVGMAMGVLVGMMFGSKKGRQQIDKAAHWTENMAEDLNKKVDEMRDITEEKYNRIVDDIADKYKKVKGIRETEVDDFVKDLKMRWDRVKDQWNS